MSAKSELFEKLKYLDTAILSDSLIDDGVAISEHNGAANLLRKGLGIVAFNILEDFIKNKSLETLDYISGSGIQFSNLPNSLQENSILGAIKSLVFRANIKKKEGGDWRTLIQNESLKIHSTQNNPYKLSKYSLVSANSNISAQEVNDLLKSFSIDGGWRKLKEISDLINGGITDLNQSYKNATERRHNSAHSVNFRYEYGWLRDIKREILSISASIDILLTARCRQVANDLTCSLTDHDINDALNFRYLEKYGSIYKETTTYRGRSRKNWGVFEDALAHIRPRLLRNGEFLIIIDSSGSLSDWYID